MSNNDDTTSSFPLLSADEVPPPFEPSRYLVPLIYPEYEEEDGFQNVAIDNEPSLSPYKRRSPIQRSQDTMLSSSYDQSETLTSSLLQPMPSTSTFVSAPVNPKEAEYLIQNAYKAYEAAEKAASCRVHAENEGMTCEVLQQSMDELRRYVSAVQKRFLEAKTERDEAQTQKLEYETKYNDLRLQYEIVLERGLNAKTAIDEARRYKEEYEKSQAVLLDVLNAYSSLKEKYNEAIKLASTFAQERDNIKKHDMLFEESESSDDNITIEESPVKLLPENPTKVQQVDDGANLAKKVRGIIKEPEAPKKVFIQKKVVPVSLVNNDHEDDPTQFNPRKRKQMKVYAGRKHAKIVTKIDTLYNLAMTVCMQNIDTFTHGPLATGYSVFHPVLARCTPEQLERIEYYNPHIEEDSDPLWSTISLKAFPKARLEKDEDESWKQCYKRLIEEREDRLREISNKIKKEKKVDQMITKMVPVISPANVRRQKNLKMKSRR